MCVARPGAWPTQETSYPLGYGVRPVKEGTHPQGGHVHNPYTSRTLATLSKEFGKSHQAKYKKNLTKTSSQHTRKRPKYHSLPPPPLKVNFILKIFSLP